MPATPRFDPARRDYAGYLVSVLVLCAVSIASGIAAGVTSTLVTIRLLVPQAASLGHLLRIVLSRALLLLATLSIRP
jgi:hypothetical protein